MSMLPVYRIPITVARSAPPTSTPTFETCLGKLKFANPATSGESDRPVIEFTGPDA
jgi:hypothetical protein